MSLPRRTRTSPGVQLVWGDLGSVTAAQKWNPLCRNMPYVVLTHHPLLVKQNKLPSGQANANGAGYGQDTNAGTLYDVNNFLQAIRDACSASNVEVSDDNGEFQLFLRIDGIYPGFLI